MSLETPKLLRCACSALFATEDGIRDHLEEYRSREQRLQIEAKKCQAHSRADEDGSARSCYNDDRDNEENEIGNPSIIRKDGSHGGYYCPDSTCQQLRQRWTKQALRRHFHRHAICEEVCVCCFKVFRSTSKFLRHAEKHANIGGRKAAFIKATCDELREGSDAQLDRALSQGLSACVGSRKRKLEMAALDSEMPGSQTATTVDQPHVQGGSEPLHPYPISAGSPVQTRFKTRSPTALPPPDKVRAAGYTPYSTEPQPPTDLSRTLDVPVLHIMNSAPAWMNTWVTNNGSLEASGTQDVMVGDRPHLQSSGQVQLDPMGTFDAPILQIMNGVPTWGADNHDIVNPADEVLGASGTQDVMVDDRPRLQSSGQVQLDPMGTFDAPILQIMNGVPAWGICNYENAI